MQSPPAGPISVNAAIEYLTLALGVHPLNDLAVLAWTAERQAIMATQRKEEKTRDDWLRRFGEVNPAVHKPVVIGSPMPPTYVAPLPRGRSRPPEVRMDAANALLLRAHPVLAKAPFHFAMLEALFGLDTLEEVRLPSPKHWREDVADAFRQRGTVRERARDRIKRALAVNAKPMIEHASNLVGVDYERE
jgi:hypothetical protein